MKTLLSCLLILAMAGAAQAQTGIYFSEYLEGSSNNKAIEIYNGTDGTLDMSRVRIERYNNGATTSPATYNYTAMLAPGDVYVIGNPSADAAILAESDEVSDMTFYNGDDVLLLFLDDVLVDSIGQLGVDPGTNWSNGGCATSEMTLVRKADSCIGDTDSGDPYDPSLEWDCYAQDTFSNLGFHTTTCAVVVPNDDTTWGAVKSLYR
ncbi:MAG: lamin tail domain-containing protein [Candidatus Krumholzibacteriia bacterium]